MIVLLREWWRHAAGDPGAASLLDDLAMALRMQFERDGAQAELDEKRGAAAAGTRWPPRLPGTPTTPRAGRA